MPSYLTALKILLRYRQWLIQLRRSPAADLTTTDLVGQQTAMVVIRRLKSPTSQVLSFWKSRSDLQKLIALLDSIGKHSGSPSGPVADGDASVKDLRHRHTHAGIWAQAQARRLRYEIFASLSPAKLVINGSQLLFAAIPDWPWRLTQEACQAGIPVATQLWGSEVENINSEAARTEAQRRLSGLLGFDISDQHNRIRLLLAALDSPDGTDHTLATLWWRYAKWERFMRRRPAALPSPVPSVAHSLHGRYYFTDRQVRPRIPERLRESGANLNHVAVVSIRHEPGEVLIIPGDVATLVVDGLVRETEYFMDQGLVAQVVAYIEFPR